MLYNVAHIAYDLLRSIEYRFLFAVLRVFPLRDCVVASAFNGEKYGDNSKYILEKVHEIDPTIKLIWLCDPDCSYEVPSYIKIVRCSVDKHIIRRCFSYYTSKVWINTHLYDKYLIKRDGQLVFETWHGGLGIKKIEGDVEKFSQNKFQVQKIKATSSISDIFISNSQFLSQLYRRAFYYTKTIWKTGFPKDDVLFTDTDKTKEMVHQWFCIPDTSKIVVYAPTYRGKFEDSGILDMSAYDIDFSRMQRAFENYWKCDCVVLLRWHPSMAKAMDWKNKHTQTIIDASDYPEMQDIICASDAFISDYSSCLFEAALREIPCIIYANDFDEYLGDRGSYFTLNELPFPHATNNDELCEAILHFQEEPFVEKWNKFVKDMGLFECGNASERIAKMIANYVVGDGTYCEEILAKQDYKYD